MFDGVNLPEPPGFHDTHGTRISDRSEDWNIATLHETSFFKNHPRWESLPHGLDSSERKRDNYQRYVKDMLRVIASLDENIGRLLDYLDRSGLSQNTIVVITSDNGYFIGEHGWIDKKVVYDESIRIPLVVRWPGHIQPSSVNDEFVLNIDFAPTWLNIAGVTVPGSMQGRSIYPLFSGKIPASWRNSVYLQYYTTNRFPYYAIRTRDYKLIHFYDPAINGWEFYDLKKDPHEMVNAYNNPAYRKVIMDLTSQLAPERSSLGIDSTLENNI